MIGLVGTGTLGGRMLGGKATTGPMGGLLVSDRGIRGANGISGNIGATGADVLGATVNVYRSSDGTWAIDAGPAGGAAAEMHGGPAAGLGLTATDIGNAVGTVLRGRRSGGS